MLKPVKLKPAFQDYLWGGTKLRDEYNKDCDFDKIAESWELSNHKNGQSIVDSGEFKGLKFGEYVEKLGAKGLGSNCDSFEFFPILIKFIDAKGSLSIQVHPDDEYALRVEKEYGKTEMWYVLEAEEGASLYYGVNKEISKEEFADRIKNDTILEVLNKVEVKKGDVFFIESGTIHAIGAGLVICEIQQNSNTTYRVYDFGRLGADGKPRELHVDKAIDVTNLTPNAKSAEPMGELEKFDGYTRVLLSECKYFTTIKYEVETKAKVEIDEKSFNSVIITEGNGKLVMGDTELEFIKGDSIFIPAQNGKYSVEGKCEFILSRV